MSMDAGALLLAAGMVVAGVVWLVRLEGRINVTDARFQDILRRLDHIDTKLS